MNFQDYFNRPLWWGKLIGGFFGYLIAGPVGAFFGLLAGSVFDRGLLEHVTNPYWAYHTQKSRTIKKRFIETTFLMLGFLAKSDGVVSKKEI